LGLESKSEADQQTQENANRQQQAIESNASLGQRAAESAGQQQLEAERLAAQQAEAQQRLQLETQAAARKFQAQQGYAQAVQQGVDPIHAMMKFGPLMGESLAGLGPLSLSQTRMQQAAVAPQPVNGPDGSTIGQTYGGRFYPTPRTATPKATLPDKWSAQDKAQYGRLNKVIDSGEDEDTGGILTPAKRAELIKERDALTKEQEQPPKITPQAIAKLQANPDKASDFDKLFGEGAAKKILYPKGQGFIGTPGGANLSQLPQGNTGVPATPPPPPAPAGRPQAQLPPSYSYDPTSGAYDPDSAATANLGEQDAARLAELQAKLAQGADKMTRDEAMELIQLQKQAGQ
jgi:hypothetical protein